MKRALAAALVLALAGCGFRLRGAAELPFETIYIPQAHQGVALELKRNIQWGTRTRVVDDAKSAEAVLQFTQEQREKHVLSLDAAGRAREYQLRYRVGFRVHDAKGTDVVPASVLELTREVTFNDALVLAKETEEQLLYRDMQADMVRQILLRLAGAGRAQRP
jgi:LPS-assembly lipoprotein